MNPLHLVRIPFHTPKLLRFAHAHGLPLDDTTQGYILHAWLTALFGEHAPKPFRLFEKRQEVLGYTPINAATLLHHAQSFASSSAWEALHADGLASKPLPAWQTGQRLRIEVLTCPVSRKEGEEKDIYLRTLDRLGDGAPPRAEVYRQWFWRQWGEEVALEHVELLGMQARVSLYRRSRKGPSRLQRIERPQALFAAELSVRDGTAFQARLARGLGRHRAFGFGMILLAPPR